MYQTNTVFKIPNTFVLDRNRERKAVFYGRVSTEHEAQLAALENQMQWYEDQAKYHPNWTVLDKYIDMYNRILIQSSPHRGVEKWLKRRLSAD